MIQGNRNHPKAYRSIKRRSQNLRLPEPVRCFFWVVFFKICTFLISIQILNDIRIAYYQGMKDALNSSPKRTGKSLPTKEQTRAMLTAYLKAWVDNIFNVPLSVRLYRSMYFCFFISVNPVSNWAKPNSSEYLSFKFYSILHTKLALFEFNVLIFIYSAKSISELCDL